MQNLNTEENKITILPMKNDNLLEEDLIDDNNKENNNKIDISELNNKVKKTSRENSRERPKKKNKLVFKNNIMNKIEGMNLPSGALTQRITTKISNKDDFSLDKNINKEICENNYKKSSIDESNVQDELNLNLTNISHNTRNLSPDNNNKDIESMNKIELNHLGEQILEKNSVDMHKDLQQIFKKIKSQNDENKENNFEENPPNNLDIK